MKHNIFTIGPGLSLRRFLPGLGAILAAVAQTTPEAYADASSPMPEIFGSVIYADGWTTQQNAIGVYRIPTSEEMEFERLSERRIDASSGGVVTGDTYWTCNFIDYIGTPFVMVSGYDISTWEETFFDYGDATIISTGVACDPTTGSVYGCFRNDTSRGYVFGTVDYPTMTRKAIADLPRPWSAVAIDRRGKLYAIDELGDLYSVDKASGDMILIGNTGLTATNPSSAAIDYRTGRFFYALTSAPDGSLYEINTDDATATLIYHFPANEEIVGMFIPVPEAEDGAPDAGSAFTPYFPEGSLSGNVSFTAPATTFDGLAGSGPLSFTLESSGTLLASGTCGWGEDVTVPLEVAERGEYTLTLSFTNSVGKSPSIEKSLYIGPDTPVAPEVNLRQENGKAYITVSPVTETLHGGYADFGNMTYTVTRLPDNKVIPSPDNSLVFVDVLPSEGTLSSYQYSVVASHSGISSDVTLTEKIWTGALIPPYNASFADKETAESYVIEDCDGDGVTWQWSASDKAFRNPFNRKSDHDDWLITPPLSLEKGQLYKVRISMRTYLGNPERFEICCGRDASAETMTTTLIEPTTFRARQAEEFVSYIAPDEDGLYFVGIHSISSAHDAWYIYVDSVAVDAGVSNDVPGKAEFLEITPDYGGELKADIKIVAPTVSGNGNPLSSLSRMELRRQGELIHTFDAPVPGDTLLFTDHPKESGYYLYDITPFNELGEGSRTEMRVFVGVNSPAKPEWADIKETENIGEVTVTWSPVTTAADGSPLNPDLVTYDLMTVDDTNEGEPYAAAEGVTGSSFTLQVPGADKTQKFAYYAVKAVTSYDYSLMTLTPFLPVGPAYRLPYSESFRSGNARTLMRPENDMALWSIYTDNSGIPSHDRDNGMAAMFGELYGAEATLYTGKIDLGDAECPVLSFYTFNITGSEPDLNELHISIGVGTKFLDVKSIVISELGQADGWYPVIIPLTEYKGKEIQIAFRGVTRNRQFTLLDNITVSDAPATDLKAGLLTVPATVAPGEEFGIEAGVENVGLLPSGDFTVHLFCNDEEVDSFTGTSLASGATEIVRFTRLFNATDEETNTHYFTVTCSGDMIPDNNTSVKITTDVLFPLVPSPRNLHGKADNSGVSLEWEEPDLALLAPPAYTEDFEDWTPWTKEGEMGWTFVDLDESGIGTIQNVALPGIEYDSKLAWFLFDSSLDGLNEGYTAASGNNYLSTMFCLPLGDFRYVANDDWAISPKLFGCQQTISLMARSLNPYEAEESFEILYTDSDTTDPSQFISLEKVNAVPGEWTSYSFKLPEGSLRFAIRYDKTYGLMLNIDDVTFVPAGNSDLILSGYNVYRDGECVTSTPLPEPFHTESTICAEDVRYAVSAIYSNGDESRTGTPIVLNINNAVGDFAGSDVRIEAARGMLIVSGAGTRDLKIFTAEGQLILSRICGDREEIALPGGIYIVSVAGQTLKVLL